MEFLKIWEIIIGRRRIILIVFSAIFATVVIGTRIATPIYEAKAKILIESSDTLSSLMSSLGLEVGAGRGATDQEGTYDTEIALLTIRPLLEKLISSLNLKDRDGERLKPEDLTESSTISPQPYIEVEQYGDSYLLEITSNSTNPAEAANMSNELAKFYLDDKLEQTRKEYKTARVFIEKQIKDIKDKYFNSLLEKKDFMIQEETIDLQAEIINLLEYILDLDKEYRDNEIVIAQADENISLIEEKIGGKEYVSTILVNQLESSLNEFLIDISGKSVDFTGEHPEVSQLNRQVDTVKRILKDKAEVVFKDEEVSIAPIYEDLIRNLKDAYVNKKVGKIKRDLLKQYINKAQDELIKIPSKSTRQSEIELSLTVNQNIYQNLLEYRTQVGIAESMTLSNIRLVEPAVEPDVDEPVFPKKVLNYVLGIFFGSFCGLSLAFFMEYIDNTINNPDDLKDYKVTFLGAIPKFSKMPLVAKMDPNDPVYEAYRTILSSIHFARLDKPPKKFLITSIGPKEGSSTTLVNLGILYAREGKRVLLVDTDLRRPSLHQLFKLSNKEGLADLLLGKAKMERVIHESGIEGLNILPSGQTPPDPGLLLKSNKMRDIIERLEEKYDILIFDSAPLLIKNDAVLLINYLDDMIVILRSGVTTHHAVSRVDELLKNAKISPVGVVLNYA